MGLGSTFKFRPYVNLNAYENGANTPTNTDKCNLLQVKVKYSFSWSITLVQYANFRSYLTTYIDK